MKRVIALLAIPNRNAGFFIKLDIPCFEKYSVSDNLPDHRCQRPGKKIANQNNTD